jgi:hypothetical protein
MTIMKSATFLVFVSLSLLATTGLAKPPINSLRAQHTVPLSTHVTATNSRDLLYATANERALLTKLSEEEERPNAIRATKAKKSKSKKAKSGNKAGKMKKSKGERHSDDITHNLSDSVEDKTAAEPIKPSKSKKAKKDKKVKSTKAPKSDKPKKNNESKKQKESSKGVSSAKSSKKASKQTKSNKKSGKKKNSKSSFCKMSVPLPVKRHPITLPRPLQPHLPHHLLFFRVWF